jgi:hypothetical protein
MDTGNCVLRDELFSEIRPDFSGAAAISFEAGI